MVLGGLIAIHLVRLLLPDAWDAEVLRRLAFVPGRLTYAFAPSRVAGALIALSSQGQEGLRAAQVGRFFLGNGTQQPWTVVTYGLLHASGAHLGLNGVWLLAFGTPIARRLGSGRFAAFIIAATAAGAAGHYATHMFDLQPVIGASAAVSGCMGAALRFVFQPELPVSVGLGLSGPPPAEAARAPVVPLLDLFRDRRAATFLIAWFLTNLLFGIGPASLGFTEGIVAWQAHIGGFLLGLLFFPLFDRAPPPALGSGGPEPDRETTPERDDAG